MVDTLVTKWLNPGKSRQPPAAEEAGMTALSGQAEYDLYGPSVIADPYPTYHAMRAAGPSSGSAESGTSPPTHWRTRCSRDQSFGRGEQYIALIHDALGPGPLFDSLSRWILFLDPPDHTRIRSLVMRAFTPRAVSRLRAMIQAMVDELVDQLVDGIDRRREADFLRDFAYPLPVSGHLRATRRSGPTIAKTSRPGRPTLGADCKSRRQLRRSCGGAMSPPPSWASTSAG